ncbi:MAG: SPFH domain-containing protein [Kiritimatiellia bacterium]
MKNSITRTVISGVMMIAFVWWVWMWGFCRIYVEPDQMAVIIAKIGKELPPGQILASKGQRGVQEDVLSEGRHFLNPVLYEVSKHPVIQIPPGKVGVITAKVGDKLPDGEFLASPGQMGIQRNVLGPGKYRLNPYGYSIEVVNAISIPIGFVGVVTSLSGDQTPEGSFAVAGQKGVLADVLQPGLYYVNPREYKVDVLEVGVNQVSLLGREGGVINIKTQIATQNQAMDKLQAQVLQQQREQRQSYIEQASTTFRKTTPTATRGRSQTAAATADGKPLPAASMPHVESGFVLNQYVEFPSKDGFEISLDMTVEFELLPSNLPWLFRSYGDLPAAVEKVIMPQILSVSRLKGSAYGARDFIIGEGREIFQNDLTSTLFQALDDKRIIVHNALIRHVNVPMQILDPIQQASMAQEQNLTNRERQNTARKQAELNTELSLIEQRREQVQQETEKIKAEIKAEQEKTVAEIRADTIRQIADIQQETAGVRAERITTIGKARADIVRMVEGEKAKGFELKVGAVGDPYAYNLWTFAENLNPDVKINILHAGTGTLWTDLEKATLGELGGATIINQSPK